MKILLTTALAVTVLLISESAAEVATALKIRLDVPPPEDSAGGILVADVWGKPIDEWPEWGRLSLVDQMGIGVGGCAANTGMSLVKLGVDTAVMGKVGRDGFGTFVANEIEATGVDVSGIGWDDEVGTSASMVIIDSEGERTFLHSIGANATVRPAELNMDLILGA